MWRSREEVVGEGLCWVEWHWCLGVRLGLECWHYRLSPLRWGLSHPWLRSWRTGRLLNSVVYWCWRHPQGQTNNRWNGGENGRDEDQSATLSFLSMVETVWGALGKWTTAAGFLAMTVSLMVAYIGGAGELAAQALFQGCGVTSSQASVAFAAAAGLTLGSGYRLCEKVNQGLVLALIASFIAITVTGLPNLHISFLQYANWHQVFPKNISIGLVAFLSQGTVPTILSLFQGNVSKARKAILWGNTIPLIVYALWEAVALGEVPHSEGQLTAAAFLSMLGSMNGPLFSPAIQVFSLCAISSSAIGVGLSVSDTISDIFRGKVGEDLYRAPREYCTVGESPVIWRITGFACSRSTPDFYINELERGNSSWSACPVRNAPCQWRPSDSRVWTTDSICHTC
mmetsp:Transcript_10502/g.21147  ORF Transcript_10502/g.21147 Transcript_10502/m.21147 type:complete len:398 (-) Transcript_10502:2546-3739(-)